MNIKTIFSFLQHKKRILFLVSLPPTPEFQRHDGLVEECLDKLYREGVTTSQTIDSKTLSTISKYDVVILVAHLDEKRNELVLRDSHLSITSFVDSLPRDFKGVLDFSSCYAGQWMKLIKERCPNCHVQGVKSQAMLKYRLTIYPYVIKLYNSDMNLEYKEAYQRIVEASSKIADVDGNNNEVLKKSDIIAGDTLGKASYIYSPSEVIREEPFLVQVYINKDNSEDQISLRACRKDSNARFVESLKLKLKKGDTITVQYSVFPNSEYISVDDPIQAIEWDGDSCEFYFNVIVEKEFTRSSFTGTILLIINNKPMAKCPIVTNVGKEKNEIPSDLNLQLYDPNEELIIGKNRILEQLTSNLEQLESQLANEKNEVKIKMLNSNINTCRKCIELTRKPDIRNHEKMKKTVFVSSTCEEAMRPYREAVRDVVKSLELNVDLCEEWSHGSYPSDKCCQQVIDSDIYICILGGRYGYIEPSLGISMTQMEYEAAKSTNKDILIFVLTPPNDTDEANEIKEKQSEFRNYILASNCLQKFSSLEELKKFSRKGLLNRISSK